ncbi:MAG: hypothetical protein A3K10_11595 [Bacteroidetes bacterium RIFCSPLOWO2_12_FULL_31_6]|nr:MAG: hypothetical protein A3K10_11595 [Bacteroidetes bacterium RIFCSPLOWO2_12_FULL_31_6]
MTKYFLLIITLVISTLGFSQEEDPYVFGDKTTNNTATKPAKDGGFDWERVTVGGGLGMTFGSITYIEISPSIGYYFTDNILAGIGGNYTYYSEKAANFNTSIYGGRVFGEYIFSNIPILLHTELELINIESYDNTRINIVNPYIGGGLKQSFGGHSYFFILVLWNLNETKESFLLQPNPVIRGGIAIGL